MSLKISSPIGPIKGRIATLKFTTDRKGVVHITNYNPLATPTERSKGQKEQNAVFGMSIRFAHQYKNLLNACFDKGKYNSGMQAFYCENLRFFKVAFADLAQRELAGDAVGMEDINTAVENYATAHPNHIRLTKISGYKDYYMNGAIPAQIVISSTSDGHEVVVRNADNTLTQIFPQSDDDTTISIPSDDSNSSSQVVITTIASPNNGGTVTGGGSYAQGAQVTLRATANSGYIFSRWSDGNTQPERTVSATGNNSYTAMFTQNQNGGYDSGN